MRQVYFSVSGIGTARTSELFHKLKLRLPDRIGDRAVVFVDNPFKGWPHPLVWAEDEKSLEPSSRLLKCWTALNEAVCKRVRPALEDGSLVITNRFGLDALLFATALEECEGGNCEAERVHHALVKLRIIEQKLPPPIYLIPRVGDRTAIREEWLSQSPALNSVDPETLCRYLDHEEATIARYFEPRFGQNKPFFLEASLRLDQLCDVAVERITTTLRQRAVA